MELIMLSAGCIVFYFFWKKIWQPVILGYYRDKLFDVRDDFRGWAAGNELLNDNAYKYTRIYINSSLRYLEEYGFIEMMSLLYAIKKNPELAVSLKSELLERLHSDDKRITSRIKDVRRETGDIITKYIVLRCFPLSVIVFLLSFIYICVYIVRHICEIIFLGTKDAISWKGMVTKALAACIIFLNLSGPANMRHAMTRQLEVAVAFADGQK